MGASDDRSREAAVAETMVSGEHHLPTPTPAPASKLDADRYQLLEVLGRGGMGEVHKAWDPQLGRRVALKVMRHATPELAQRLIAEARAQARVEHPHVCKVYGVGEMNGMPFIALQFIDGPTLGKAAPEMTREERIAVMRDVAEALHAAHRQGLVHRDVKPANILVERTDAGYKAYVTDFGIARLVDAPGLTKTGVAQGTPLYMAPEQARGDAQRIDRRTDVYALGVTLYELLAGRRPFEGDTSLGVILKLLHEEAPPLRTLDPSIPVDLETITMKCLEKDPARRYDSARALAEDLQAWLDGEPIQARRSSLGYRLAKRAKKHLALLVGAALLVVAAGVFGGFALKVRRQAAEQARLAHAFGQEVERTDAIARYSALLPLHDTRRERAMIEARLGDLERRIGRIGQAAEGPGRYALGRGYLVLDRPDDARRELERAFAAGYRAPEVSYALGLALSLKYQRALSVPASGDATHEAARRAELAERYREPALAHLRAATGLQLEAPEYAEGLIALHEGRFDAALEKARAAEERVPWMYEAHTLEGDIHLNRAKERWGRGELDEALAALDRAGAAYRTASAIAHSSAAALQGDCRRLGMQLEIEVDRDRPPEAVVQAALSACDQALIARPDDPSLFLDEADVLLQVARYHRGHMGDPNVDWERAEKLTQLALGVAPDDEQVQLEKVYLEKSRAEWEQERGIDPRPRVERAMTIVKAILRAHPRSDEALSLAGDLYTTRGDWESNHGLDPRGSYDLSADAAVRSLALRPAGFKLENAIGLAYLSKGMWELNNGADPERDLAAARERYDRVVRANPKVDYGYLNLCATWQTLAEYQTLKSRDPMPALLQAIDTCEKALAVDPNWAGSFLNLGCAHFDVAVWQRQQGVDPTRELELARVQLKKGLEVDHEYELSYRYLGEVELLAGRWAADHGKPAEAQAAFAAADLELRHALGSNARNADTLRELAEVRRFRAQLLQSLGRPVETEVRVGLERAAEALAVNPRHGAAALQAGALHLVLARSRAGQQRREEAERAVASLEQARAWNGNLERDLGPLLAEARQLLVARAP